MWRSSFEGSQSSQTKFVSDVSNIVDDLFAMVCVVIFVLPSHMFKHSLVNYHLPFPFQQTLLTFSLCGKIMHQNFITLRSKAQEQTKANLPFPYFQVGYGSCSPIVDFKAVVCFNFSFVFQSNQVNLGHHILKRFFDAE